VDQEVGGTRPVEFTRDRCELEALIDQFAQRTERDDAASPIFGRLSTAGVATMGLPPHGSSPAPVRRIMSPMSDSSDPLRVQLARALDWEEAHVGFDNAVDASPLKNVALAHPGSSIRRGSCSSTCASRRKTFSTSA
jgi:hypothetical protein